MLHRRLYDFLLSRHSSLFWKWRHIWDRKWADTYASAQSIAHPHRTLIIEMIRPFSPRSLLEVGCASGPNLFLITVRYPDVNVFGYDISQNAINIGKKILSGYKNVMFYNSDQEWDGRTYDIILTDATLIYFNGKEVKDIIEKMKDRVNRALIFCEWHDEGESRTEMAHWVHDYKKLFGDDASLYKIPTVVWPGGGWEKYGHMIVWKKPN